MAQEMAVVWHRRAIGGWVASANGHMLTVTRYPAWRGRQLVWTYVPRIDSLSAAGLGPALALATLAEARALAEEWATQPRRPRGPGAEGGGK